MAASDAAQALNSRWDALAVQFDKYYGALSPAVRSAVGAALAKWQDFYFGSDTWPAAELASWTGIFQKTEETLLASTSKAAPAPAVNTTAARAVAGNVISVTGKSGMTASTVPDFRLPSVWWFIAGSVPALAALYLSRPQRSKKEA